MSVALRRVFRLVNGGTPIADEVNWGGDVQWATPVDLARHNGGRITSTDRTLTREGLASGSRAVDTGSLIVSTRAPIGYVAEATVPMAFNQGCRGLEPMSPVDVRYFRYQLASIAEQLQSLGNGSTFVELSTEALASVPLAAPPLAEQRAIADYLDAETARIDALIAKKQQLIRLFEERREFAFDKALLHFGVDLPSDLDLGVMRSLQLPRGWRVAKLSGALRQLTNGYVGPTRDILVDEGVRYIQGLHVKRGTIDFERRPFFVTESWHRARPRTSLRSGDVVIVQTGDIGQCAVIPDDFGEANCHALLIARTNENVTCGPYLATYLQSRFGRHSLLRLATGALHPHLEFGIRDAPLLLPPKATQSEIVDLVRSERELLDAGCAKVGRQISLLAEHRQALVMAAVTGQFAVPA